MSALDRETGQLLQRAEVLEGRGEGPEPTLLEERPEPDLDRGSVAQGRVPRPVRKELVGDVVEVGQMENAGLVERHPSPRPRPCPDTSKSCRSSCSNH